MRLMTMNVGKEVQHTFYISPLHISPISLFRRYFTQDPQSLGLSRRRRKRSDFHWKYRILTETLGFHPKFAGISPKCLGICPKHAFRSITLLSIFGHFLYLAIFFPRTPPAKYRKCAVPLNFVCKACWQSTLRIHSFTFHVLPSTIAMHRHTPRAYVDVIWCITISHD